MNTPNPITPRLLTPKQAAAYLAVCGKTLYTLTKDGKLPAVRCGGILRYEIADLDGFIRRCKGVQ